MEMSKESVEDCKTLYIACDKVKLTENGFNVFITLPRNAIKEVNTITINGVEFINNSVRYEGLEKNADENCVNK